MNRDNALFATIGLLAGFLLGYIGHEVMAARQPPRRALGTAAVAAPAAGTPTTTTPASGSSAAPMMAEVQRLQQRMAENPQDAEALRRLADMNYDIQNWKTAAELYERYLALRPDDLNAMTDLGASYRYLGDPNRALDLFRTVRSRSADNWQVRYNEVLVLAFDLEDLVTASEAMGELAKMQPDNATVARLSAEIAKRLKGT